MAATTTRRPIAGSALLLAVLALAAGPAHAGVPRVCIHPDYDPVLCRVEKEADLLDVLPSARIRALERQRHDLERVVPLQDAERNRLLERIREALEPTPER